MAPMRAMRAAIPAMAERGWGRVVNVARARRQAALGEHGRVLGGEGGASCRSRASSPTATPATGVLVNAVCPGPTKSELWMARAACSTSRRRSAATTTRDDALEAAGAKRPIGRLAEVDEIAAAIVFLCSERASYVAGAAWSVDGGTVQVII